MKQMLLKGQDKEDEPCYGTHELRIFLFYWLAFFIKKEIDSTCTLCLI